jgi:uncharacterized membrane protein
MFKKRYFSTKHDFKTGFYSKLSLTLGIILLIIFVFFKISSFLLTKDSTGFLKSVYEISQTTTVDSIGAFSIILIAVGIIVYFLYLQFVKLDQIAEDIRKDTKNEE